MDINGVIRVNMTGAEIEEALLKARDLPTNAQLTTILNEMQTDIDARLGRIEEKTYDEMVALRDAAELVPGQLYRITDYVTTTKVEHTQSAGHPFDIVVLALSPNTLSEAAMAMVHEGDEYFAGINLSAWQLKYTLDNIEHSASDGKGTITFMHDERNCEACFDFKNIQFKRWKVTDALVRSSIRNKYLGVLHYLPRYLTIDDETDFQWFFAFGSNPREHDVVTNLKVSDNVVLLADSTTEYTENCTILGRMRNCTMNGVHDTIIAGVFQNTVVGGWVRSSNFYGVVTESSFEIINAADIRGSVDSCAFMSLSNTSFVGQWSSSAFYLLSHVEFFGNGSNCSFPNMNYSLCLGTLNSVNVVASAYREISYATFQCDIENETIQVGNNMTVAKDSNGVLKIWNPADLVQ